MPSNSLVDHSKRLLTEKCQRHYLTVLDDSRYHNVQHQGCLWVGDMYVEHLSRMVCVSKDYQDFPFILAEPPKTHKLHGHAGAKIDLAKLW